MVKLTDYPVLEKWYKDNEGLLGDFDHEPIARTAWIFIDCLERKQSGTFNAWSSSLRRFFEVSNESERDFSLLQKFFSDHGFDIFELFNLWAHQAFEFKNEDEFLDIMEHSARVTNLPSFAFLAGWTAFNLDEYSQCIDFCDLAGESFGSIITLKGQAYLEWGRADVACSIFQRAVDMDPNDPLGWFLLAKSHWALSNHRKSELALLACLKNTGPNAEVAIFLSIIALDENNQRPNYEDAWKALISFLPQLKETVEFAEKVVLIGLRRGQNSELEAVLQQIPWSRLKEKLRGSPSLALILKGFGEAGLIEQSQIVLDCVID